MRQFFQFEKLADFEIRKLYNWMNLKKILIDQFGKP